MVWIWMSENCTRKDQSPEADVVSLISGFGAALRVHLYAQRKSENIKYSFSLKLEILAKWPEALQYPIIGKTCSFEAGFSIGLKNGKKLNLMLDGVWVMKTSNTPIYLYTCAYFFSLFNIQSLLNCVLQRSRIRTLPVNS